MQYRYQDNASGRRDNFAFEADDQRDRLLDLARNGMDWREVEEKAAALGMPPFERLEDPNAFDAMIISGWSPLMALAWIIFRTADAVRMSWAEYRQHCWKWHPVSIFEKANISPMRSFELVQYGPPSLADLKAAADPSKFNSSRQDLFNRLASGDLSASALHSPMWSRALSMSGRRSMSGAERIALPCIAWRDLHFHDATAVRSKHNGNIYDDVVIPRADIMRFWPLSRAVKPDPKLEGSCTKAPRFSGIEKAVYDALLEIWGEVPDSSLKVKVIAPKVRPIIMKNGQQFPGDLGRTIRHIRKALAST